ncbi:MAG TPA: zinc ribbon domain-containing protein [Candidatus Eremiobacteraeota bacterium]|nr:MAG: Zinc ribbon domain protein [bacterium ADurb.Bin363]HPZ09348.1 zinc ribbon domain-containing protein [Candidatus Eremiobacteraeota bacterium]
MPIYEYECKKCLKRFEKFLKIREDKTKVKCPDCEGTDLEKLISSFISKSSGSSDKSCGSSGFS